MLASIFFARLLGLCYIVVTIGVLLNLKRYQKVMSDWSGNSALMYLSGVFTLLFGLLIVLTHSRWSFGWHLIITVLGWIIFVKGICLIVFPDVMKKMVERYQTSDKVLRISLVVFLVLGVFLAIKGFFS